MDDAVPASHRAWWLLLAVALLLLAAVYVSTLRTGQPWGGDNAMYLLHARNLVDGTPYANTGYLYNAASGRFPISYPPVFPLLLTPLLASFGVAWTPLKLATIACFIAGLALLAAHERSRLRRPELLGFILLVGLNPVLWNFKDNVLSEYPFLMFLAAALYLADRPREPSTPRNRVARGLLFGALCYLAYGTRSVGALLIPAFVAAEAIRGQRIDASHGAAAAAFASLAGLQNALLHSETGHLIYKLGRLEPTVPLENLFVQFPSLFHAFWASGSPLEAMGILLALAAAALISFGLWGRLRSRRFDTLDGFVLASLALLLLIRLGDMNPPERYWIPLFPLFVIQLLRGLDRLPTAGRRPILAGFVILSLTSYASMFPKFDWPEIEDGITSPDALELYAFVRSHTEPQDTLIFFEPRVLTLYTGRRASEFSTQGDRSQWMAYAKSIDARYWVRPGGLPRTFQSSLSLVFSNDTFSVFRFDRYQ